MNGAEALVRTLIAGGVDTCFTNPGTSEIHIVAALDKIERIRSILCLFEGVATGAADGYARIAEKPACTLLHLGPGLGNGLANLHNARRAHVPLVNIVGQHATFHLRYDTPLTSDIETIARLCSRWVRTAGSNIGIDVADAITAARGAQGQIATLIVPADIAWSDGGTAIPIPAQPTSAAVTQETIDRAAALLHSGLRTGILLSGSALFGKGLMIAGRIAAATNAKLFAPYPITRMERGAGLPTVERVHYVLEQAHEQLREFRQLLLVGAPPPVAYFGYPGKSSVLTQPECKIHVLVGEDDACVPALEALAAVLSSSESVSPWEPSASRPSVPAGEITPAGIAAAVGALLPQGAIVVDESMTSGHGLMASTSAAPPHDWLTCTGGSIGIAMPLAVGAAIAAARDRPVLCFTADGSGMYTAQALWTMAREALNVTTIVFANRSYAVLKREFSYLGVGNPGRRALDMFEIGRPDLDWVSLAKAMGVPGKRINSLESFSEALRGGLQGNGPSLIEVPL
jgi:acetolactate synthase-1/2/3 large subunit